MSERLTTTYIAETMISSVPVMDNAEGTTPKMIFSSITVKTI